jgi:hypothetical protein
MKKETIELRKITADDGYVFAEKDKSYVYGNEIFLGKNDVPENYVEITVEEAEALREEHAAARRSSEQEQ